jgi:hypothetical protein
MIKKWKKKWNIKSYRSSIFDTLDTVRKILIIIVAIITF